MKKIMSWLEEFLVWQNVAMLGVVSIAEGINIMINNPYAYLPLGPIWTGIVLIGMGLGCFMESAILKKVPLKEMGS